MVHILESLARLENKLDHLSLSASSSAPDSTTVANSPASIKQISNSPGAGLSDRPLNSAVSISQKGYNATTPPHKIILWPSIYIHLINAGTGATIDLQNLLEEGTSWLIKKELSMDKDELPTNVGLASYPVAGSAPGSGDLTKVAFPTLTLTRAQEYCNAYFETFNVIAPILDRKSSSSFGR